MDARITKLETVVDNIQPLKDNRAIANNLVALCATFVS